MIYEVTGKRYLLKIGRAGEQNATEVVANIQPWLDQWPGGLVGVLIQRPNDDYYYAAFNVVQDNEAGTVTWYPSAVDTAQDTTKKSLKMQIIYTKGNNVIARTPIWSCRIESSLLGNEDPPETQADWFQRIMDAAELVYTNAAEVESWTRTFEWIQEKMDTDYPAVEVFLATVQDILDRLDADVHYDSSLKMLSIGCGYRSEGNIIIV